MKLGRSLLMSAGVGVGRRRVGRARRPSWRCVREWEEGGVVFAHLDDNARGASCWSRVSSSGARVVVKHDAVKLFRNKGKKDLMLHAAADIGETAFTTSFYGDGVSFRTSLRESAHAWCSVEGLWCTKGSSALAVRASHPHIWDVPGEVNWP